jgi:hypothetical protein
MNCPICKHGETIRSTATIALDRVDPASGVSVTIVFRGVPAEVCDNCGEQFVDEPTTREVLRQADHAVRSGVQLEVRQYAAA